MTTLLELNDADLTLYREGRPVYRAPGIAVLTDREIVFGEPALRMSRIYPRQTHQQYLSRMNTDPLEQVVPRARSQADLVYLHAREFAGAVKEPIIVAVPAVFSTDQLGILLGILEQAGITVAGFVDSAVAAATAVPLADPTWHCDILLNRAVLTALGNDGQVSRHRIEEVADCGLARLLDAWIDVIADRFIRETRFDPLHSAATEQQLYNQVFDLFWSGSTDREVAFELVQGNQTRRVEVGRALLEARAAGRFRRLTAALPRAATLLLTPRAASLPGLAAALAEARIDAVVLPDDALTTGCAANFTQIVPNDGDLRLITRLPARQDQPTGASAQTLPPAPAGEPAPAAARQAGRNAPSHVLYGHRALPLDHPALEFTIVRHGEVALLHAAADLTLNDTTIFRETALEVGDRIARHGREYLVISVET